MTTSFSPTHLFVYGTLLSDIKHPAGQILRDNAALIGSGTITGRLYDLGASPALTLSANEIDQVFGEVFQFYDTKAMFYHLDAS